MKKTLNFERKMFSLPCCWHSFCSVYSQALLDAGDFRSWNPPPRATQNNPILLSFNFPPYNDVLDLRLLTQIFPRSLYPQKMLLGLSTQHYFSTISAPFVMSVIKALSEGALQKWRRQFFKNKKIMPKITKKICYIAQDINYFLY